MAVTTVPDLTLDCTEGSANPVTTVNPSSPANTGALTCTGTYAVTQMDLETGQLSFTAQATSSTLPTGDGTVVAQAPVVLTMVAQPQLEVDVVASSCRVIPGAGMTVRTLFVCQAWRCNELCVSGPTVTQATDMSLLV